MMRIWTYLTLNLAGDPASAGTYFDPTLADVNAQPGQNILVQSLRDGTELIVWDPQPQFENRGVLIIGGSHVDLRSTVQYAGLDRYLGAVLATHFRNHMPIAIFMRSTQETHPKAYLAWILRPEAALLAAATDDTHDQLFLTRANPMKTMRFELYIDRSGHFTDYDDITAVVWGVRH